MHVKGHLMGLVARQMVLEVVLASALAVVTAGSEVAVFGLMVGLFAGAFLVGRADLDADQALIRGLALRSGLVHAALGALGEGLFMVFWSPFGGLHLVITAVVFTSVLLGVMAGVLSLVGLNVGAYTRKS
ncbi:MAG: hypothetical protein JRJ84_24665 [Deltaproteobacteria bacterium]|nr:hypothetical protein [Deltaproteobacteria bacterium]